MSEDAIGSVSEASASQERLSIRYDGPALEANSMDVRELAPSLLALADLFAIAHNQVGPTLAPPPALQVTAQRQGSFIVDLWLSAQDAEETLVDLLNGRHATAAVNASGLVAVVIGAVAWVVGRFRKGDEEAIEEIEPGRVRITWEDGTHLDAPLEAKTLVEHLDFNRMAGRVFQPLRRDGIDRVDLQTGVSRTFVSSVHVEREDLRAFNVPGDDEGLLSDNTREVAIKVENLAFKPGNKWRVHDGTASLWASVVDLGFIQRMSAGEERFADGDTFIVQMRDKQYQSSNGVGSIRTDHFIEKVIQHRSTPPPETLPFEG